MTNAEKLEKLMVKYTIGESVSPKSEKAEKLQEILQSKVLSQDSRDTLARILSILTGEEIVCKNTDLKRFRAYVPERCSNSHNYPIGRVCVATSDCAFLVREDGTLGNNINIGDCRIPTNEEIHDFCVKFPKEAFDEFFPELALIG